MPMIPATLEAVDHKFEVTWDSEGAQSGILGKILSQKIAEHGGTCL